MENYLHGRFGTLGFLDRGYLQVPADQRWNKSSPQHVNLTAFERLIPTEFLAASFAVIRHPAQRLRSIFLYQRDVVESIRADAIFSSWLRTIPDLRQQNPYLFDNHLRPMSEMVPKNAKIFKLDEGLEPMVRWFDGLAGDEYAKRPKPINGHIDRIKGMGKDPRGPIPELDARDLTFISKMDAIDFERFGYTAAIPHPDS